MRLYKAENSGFFGGFDARYLVNPGFGFIVFIYLGDGDYLMLRVFVLFFYAGFYSGIPLVSG